jgi:hypothetical protein
MVTSDLEFLFYSKFLKVGSVSVRILTVFNVAANLTTLESRC